jgi:hypothetical protein
MSTRANIVIRYNQPQPHRGQHTESDLIVLYKHWDGYPQGVNGCSNVLIMAYDEARNSGKLGSPKDKVQAFSQFLILTRSKDIEPVDSECYDWFHENGSFADAEYVYHIIFPRNGHPNNQNTRMTVYSALFPSALFDQSIKEWQRYSDVIMAWSSIVKDEGIPRFNTRNKTIDPLVADSLYSDELYARILVPIYKSIGKCPCDICMVRPTCISVKSENGNEKIRKVRRNCEKKVDFVQKAKRYLSSLLSRDRELDRLIRSSIKRTS